MSSNRPGTRGPIPQNLALRFWSKVDRSGGQDACWPWTAGRNESNYGRMWIGSKADGTWRKVGAHVIAWSLTNERQPTAFILHKCDNPPCCNPSHLFEGTQTDNMRDAAAKGRLNAPRPSISGDGNHQRQKTHCRHGHAYDEINTRWLADGTRQCRLCNRNGWRKWSNAHLTRRAPITHCPQGHAYDSENTHVSPKGYRVCRTCKREQMRARRLGR